MKKYVLAVDLGTTGNRVIAFDRSANIAAKSYYEFTQIFPKPGWVEHDPMEILKTTLKALKAVVSEVGAGNIDSIGITNQRETAVVWDKITGKPIYNAIVWQDRRTAELCRAMKKHEKKINAKTGLFLDPYFSATKIKWLLDNVKGARKRVSKGGLLFGTIDTWILWNITGGRVHATEPGNASRTLLYNINELKFDEELLKLFNVPAGMLPEVRQSASEFGLTDKSITGIEAPVKAILGDQQASFFAHGGKEGGIVKNTYGTGLFLVSLCSKNIKQGKLIKSIAWQLNGKTDYCIEGSIFIGGSLLQWLRDGLKIIDSAPETEKLAKSLDSNEGVYFVPALAGLGAPYWDPTARGMIIGLTRATRREHLARAALEAICYEVKDVFDLMKSVTGGRFLKLMVDGGASKNDFLMQFQSDMLAVEVVRPEITEITALGAAGLAGISSGFWSQDEFYKVRKIDKIFKPSMKEIERIKLFSRWKDAVRRSAKWAL